MTELGDNRFEIGCLGLSDRHWMHLDLKASDSTSVDRKGASLNLHVVCPGKKMHSLSPFKQRTKSSLSVFFEGHFKT